MFITLLLIDRDGREHELTRGWLRASQRKLRDDSEPWEPIQAHEKREPLEPGKIYELKIPIVPTARLFQAGERIALRIKGADDEPAVNSLQALARNHIRRPRPAAHHDPPRRVAPVASRSADHPRQYYRDILFRRGYQLVWTVALNTAMRDNFSRKPGTHEYCSIVLSKD